MATSSMIETTNKRKYGQTNLAKMKKFMDEPAKLISVYTTVPDLQDWLKTAPKDKDNKTPDFNFNGYVIGTVVDNKNVIPKYARL